MILVILIDIEVDIAEVVVQIVADIALVELYFVLVEATMDKIGCYDLLDWNNLVLCTKFQRCVNLTCDRSVVLVIDFLQRKKLVPSKIVLSMPFFL